MRALAALAFAAGLALAAAEAGALVHYDEGRRIIDGVQLLQDTQDPKAFYYLPQFPRLASKEDGDVLEFLCVKYVGAGAATNGGLFHALVEFTLPPEVEERVAARLAQEVSGAVLRGPVPLMQAVEDGQQGLGGFRVVSATLSDTGEGGFTRKVITSGRAPLTPGSKAVVAAKLGQEGATLLWETLRAPTSDVSVAITAYYEAQVRAYNAVVTAEMETLYTHFSELENVQGGFSKKEVRDVADELVRRGDIQVEVADRAQSLGLDTTAMDGLLELVTTKLTSLLFDAQAGWAEAPPKEVAVAADQIKGRQEQGWLDPIFGGERPYYTDNQYVLKQRSDIQRNTFRLNLSRSTTIRVPVDSAGNLGGLYEAFGEDPRYFRIVNLEDPVFEKRAVHFQIDGNYLDSFQDTINFVSVNFRKTYSGKPAVTRSLLFTHEDVKNGRTVKELLYPRLGEESARWREYEYQVRWSVRDRPTVGVPADEGQWIRTEDPAVSLVPPFEKRVIEIDADRSLFGPQGIATAVVEFATPIAGRPKIQRKATLRATDPDPTTVVSIYHDRDQAVGWRVIWHGRGGRSRSTAQGLDSDYLYLVPPAPEDGAAGP